jgi:hypothetical protein
VNVNAMDELVMTLAVVAGLEDPGGVDDAVLKLADGTHCRLRRQDPRFTIWLRLIEGARRSGLPVFVACTPGGEAAEAVLPAAARRIARVGPAAEGDRVPVAIEMSPATHFLNAGRLGHEVLRALLEEAAGSDAPVVLAVDPGTLEILAARRVPPGIDPVVI